MITLTRGYFGIGIESSKTEENVGGLWRSAHCFGAQFIFTIGARYKKSSQDTTKAERHIPLFEYRDSGEFLKNIPIGCTLVGIEIHPTAMNLKEFKHPRNAIYLLGPEDGSLSNTLLRECKVVSIDTKYCLNVATAGSIIMYDRSIKA